MTVIDIDSVGIYGQTAIRHSVWASAPAARRKIKVVPRCEHSDAERTMAALSGTHIRCDWVARVLQHLLRTGIPLEEARLWTALPIDPGTADRRYRGTGSEWSLPEIYLWCAQKIAPAYVLEHFVPGRWNRLPA
jgi:hypothetical protein